MNEGKYEPGRRITNTINGVWDGLSGENSSQINSR